VERRGKRGKNLRRKEDSNGSNGRKIGNITQLRSFGYWHESRLDKMGERDVGREVV